VVIQIGLGMVIGPHLLGWAHLDEVIDVLAEMGLVFLIFIFLAGFEIDPDQVKGRPVKLRGAGLAGRHGATRCDPVPTVRPGDVPGASVRSYSS